MHGLKTEDGHIAVNRRMETNIAGLFAAGDCTGRPYQYIKAAGEGNVAAHSAIEYLDKLLELEPDAINAKALKKLILQKYM